MHHRVKKHWKKPTLIVLVKKKREEGVLLMCKTSLSGIDPNNQLNGCDLAVCGACSIRSTS
jgi:hypothetical protein